MPSTPPTGQVFRVLPRQVDQTLSAALRDWLSGKSWGELRKLLRSRHVMINGNVCVDAGRRLKLQDVVKILPQAAAAPPKEDDIRIHYLDPHLVIVEKPAGLTTTRHAEERDWPQRRKQIQPTLDELLPRVIQKYETGQRARDQKSKGRSPRHQKSRGIPPPVRAVHRLDRETSGLMVFARTVKAEQALGLQFRAHATHRRYLAVALGTVQARTIETFLVRDRGDGRRGSTDKPGVGKRAVTHVAPLEQLDGYTLIECRLETGRTHQIRIHLAELGHPICGEKVYNQPLFGSPVRDQSGAPRVALHAAELGFQHPITQEHLKFSVPFPKDLAQFVAKLRKQKAGEDTA